MQHRARRHRGLPPAPLALPQRPSRQLEGFRLPAPPTPKAVGPAAGGQVLPTRLVVPKSGLELLQGLGEIGSAHLTTLSMGAFGVNPIGITAILHGTARRGQRRTAGFRPAVTRLSKIVCVWLKVPGILLYSLLETTTGPIVTGQSRARMIRLRD